ncbi:glycoside hydrolase family 16 protein [Amylostereum chailletii]|nr:glycoside hydrolase family 16 protein [Amylostereum chailletii]
MSVQSSTQSSAVDLRPNLLRQSTINGVREAFASPPLRPQAYTYPTSDSNAAFRARPSKKQRPQSTMLSGPITKPWIKHKDVRGRIAYFLTYGMILVGVAAAAVRCYFGWIAVPLLGNLCLVLDDQFNDTELNTESVWMREVDLGGFGNGEFEMTTASTNNSFIRNNQLYLLPTLTSSVIGQAAVFDGYTFNLTGCTDTNLTACGVVSNNTQGTVINPVMSARISTKGKKSIQYGRVEVRAKLPRGDWMWPAIWMLPENNTYGPWPMSGEIDIMESRGNSPDYPAQGINYVRGSLNWGPLTWLNAVSKTFGWWTTRRTSYDQDFHTYALEWTEKFLRIYVDSRLTHMLNLQFNEPFFERGDFPASVSNASQEIILNNPWVGRGNSAPFDQPFYLILDVAIGGTNGWFPDGAGNKPWLNGATNAMQVFAQKQDEWLATWPEDDDDRAMRVDSVKMWQQC